MVVIDRNAKLNVYGKLQVLNQNMGFTIALPCNS